MAAVAAAEQLLLAGRRLVLAGLVALKSERIRRAKVPAAAAEIATELMRPMAVVPRRQIQLKQVPVPRAELKTESVAAPVMERRV